MPYGRYPNGQATPVQSTQQVLERHTKTIPQMCLYIGTAQISHLWLMPGLLPAHITICMHQYVCKVASNEHGHVGQIKGPGVQNQVVPRLLLGTSVALRGAIQGVWRACMPPARLCKVLLPCSNT
eukprot:6196830-Pleurochrysis_carterae.AAC.5